MRLSTTTHLYARNEKSEFSSVFESMEFCAKAGFSVLDLNMTDGAMPHSFLNKDHWMDIVAQIAEKQQQLGLEFSQSHPPFYDVWNISEQERAWQDTLIRRAIITGGILGVKWNVMHALTFYEPLSFYRAHLDVNTRYFAPFVALAEEHGTGIAIENMPQMPGLSRRGTEPKGRVFSALPEDLLDLIAALSSDHIGVCWDFGHGNITGVNAPLAISHFGKHLKATHVNDNFGQKDDHLAPYYGDGMIHWEQCVAALREICYEGDFTYEIHHFINQIPLESQFACAQYIHTLGENLIGGSAL